MKLVCWHHATGHRLQTWIPVLILIQCGLIVLYISIVQHEKENKAEKVIVQRAEGQQQTLSTVRVFQSNASQRWDGALQNVGGALQSPNGIMQRDGAELKKPSREEMRNNREGLNQNAELMKQKAELMKNYMEGIMPTTERGKQGDGQIINKGRSGTRYTLKPKHVIANESNISKAKFADNKHITEAENLTVDGKISQVKPNHRINLLKMEENASENMVGKSDSQPQQSITLFQQHGKPVNDALYADPDSPQPRDPAQSGSIMLRSSKDGDGEITQRAEASDVSLTRAFSHGKRMEGLTKHVDRTNGLGNEKNEGTDSIHQGEQKTRIHVEKTMDENLNKITRDQKLRINVAKPIAENADEIDDNEIPALRTEITMDRNNVNEDLSRNNDKDRVKVNMDLGVDIKAVPNIQERTTISKEGTNSHTEFSDMEVKNDKQNFDNDGIQKNPMSHAELSINTKDSYKIENGQITIKTQRNHSNDQLLQDVSARHLNKSHPNTLSRHGNRSAGPYADSLRKQLKISTLLRNQTVITKPIVNTTYGVPSFQQGKTSTSKSNLFREYNINAPPAFVLQDDSTVYFTRHPRNLTCLGEGTENVFVRDTQAACICRPSWNGPHCSVPDAAMYTSALRYMNSLKPLIDDGASRRPKGTEGSQYSNSKVRRTIHAITFNVEWELLEARLYELGDLVDVYIIAESNYTQYGEPKPLRLLERLRKGYLQEFHHKICYLFMGIFPEGGKENGWVVDQFARTYIGLQGLQQIKGVRPDDIFIYTDADEIPSREVLLFLKLHHGYPEPFGLALRWSVFGFFWKQYDMTRIMVGCSVEMLKKVFQNDVYKLRTGNYQGSDAGFQNAWGGILMEWYLGDGGAHAGWHCSWCMNPDRIQIKLISALNADFPRWGDYPEKRDLTYIRNLIKTGTWFDDKTTFNSLVNKDADPVLAPAYMLEHFTKYEHLLDLNCVK